MTMDNPLFPQRYCIRSASGKYLAAISIIGCKVAFTWTDDLELAINVTTKKVAKSLSEVCNVAGGATIPVKMP